MAFDPRDVVRTSDPAILEAIRFMREKSGIDNPSKDDIIDNLRSLVKLLSGRYQRRDDLIYQETKRCLKFMRMLTAIHPRGLRRAVLMMVYWDKFSWLPGTVVERIRENSKCCDVFFHQAEVCGNVKYVQEWTGKVQLTEALLLLGYGREAKERSRSKAIEAKGKRTRSQDREIDELVC